MDTLRIRAYNVRFGDAILITVPDRDSNGIVTKRNILIDVGNVLIGSGGQDEVFEPVFLDIQEQLDGNPLDLYVMTHEHLDHVQGMLWAKRKLDLEIRATHSWLTASAAPNYYDNFPNAKKKTLGFADVYERISLFFRTAAVQPRPALQAMLLNNNPRSTGDCVEYLRGIGETTTYVSRSTSLEGTHPFNEVEFELWAPEEDTSIYYGQFRPMGLATASTGQSNAGEPPADSDTPLPPPGVDAGAFYQLVERRRRGIFDNMLKIDQAANDSSVVFLMKWRGWNLLFSGDAEERSWKEMNKRNLLKPVHFLKVGHHGSHNGTPSAELLEKILPLTPIDEHPRSALVSTHEGTYNQVPDRHTLDEIRDRCDVIRIGEPGDALFKDILFQDLNDED